MALALPSSIWMRATLSRSSNVTCDIGVLLFGATLPHPAAPLLFSDALLFLSHGTGNLGSRRISAEVTMKRGARVLTTLAALLAGSVAHAGEKPNLDAYASARPAPPFESPTARAKIEAA